MKALERNNAIWSYNSEIYSQHTPFIINPCWKGKWVKTWPPRLSVSPGPTCPGSTIFNWSFRPTDSTFQLYSFWILEVLQASKIVLELTSFAYWYPFFLKQLLSSLLPDLVKLAHSSFSWSSSLTGPFYSSI